MRKLFFKKWKYLNNIPSLPDHLTKNVLVYCRGLQSTDGYFSPSVSPDQQSLGITWNKAEATMSGLANFQLAPWSPEMQELDTWVKNNIHTKFKINVQIITGPGFFAPHVDIARREVFNYLLDTGGTNVSTCFYKVKPEYQNLFADPGTVIPYERIYEIDRVVFEPNRWHVLNVQTVHSVENISSQRIALSITNL